jgi:osmotically-inducible protein OsmY
MKTTLLCAMIVGVMSLPGHAQQQSTGEQTGKAAQAVQTSVPSNPPVAVPSPTTASSDPATAASVLPEASDESVKVDSALQEQIQGALNRDPAFSRSGVRVTATRDGIELSGDVASGRERLNAGRIAQSYARGKKVINHIIVKGHSAPAGSNSQENPPANVNGSAGSPESGNSGPPRS